MLAAALAWGCADGRPIPPDVGADPAAPPEEPQWFDQDELYALDLVVVVATTPQMDLEQANLANNGKRLFDALRRLPGGLPDLHVGVLDTALGMGQFSDYYAREFGSICQNRGAVLQAGAVGQGGSCTNVPRGAFIESLDGGKRNNFDGTLEGAFACITPMGDRSCGPDQHFAVLRRALGGDGAAPDQNRDFLRDDAFLAVLFLTDDYDCSLAPDSALFDPYQKAPSDPLGPLDSYRCVEFGTLCNGMRIPRIPGTYDHCRSDPDATYLTPVAEFVKWARAVKGVPGRFLATTISPSFFPDRFEIVAGSMSGSTRTKPSCTSMNGAGDPSPRIPEFIAALGRDGHFESVCQDSYAGPMARVGEFIARRFGDRCVDGPFVDGDAKTPGVQPACEVFDRTLAADGTFVDRPLASCDVSGPPCSRLSPAAACALGFDLTIDRAGVKSPKHTTTGVRCRRP